MPDPVLDGPAGGRREAGKAERRARIVQAARELLRETGGAELSMRAIAARAGVSQATPYNLFGSKRAVLVSVLEDIRDFGKLFASASGLTPFERVLRAAALAVSYYEKDPDFYRVLWANLLGSAGGEDRNAIFNAKRDAFWTDLLQAAADAGQVRADLPVAALRRTLDAVFRGTMLEWAIGELPTASLQGAIALAYGLVLRGAATAAGVAVLERSLPRGAVQLASSAGRSPNTCLAKPG
jgi:AcrR family transcriptional regulator